MMHRAFDTPLAAFALSVVALPLPAHGAVVEGYRNHKALRASVQDLAAQPHCTMQIIGNSREGREIFALTLAGDPATAEQQPAMLIVAGTDGRHLVGTETALGVAARLLADHDDLLAEMTVYVLPRVNPDGAERCLLSGRDDMGGTSTPVDDDHDRLVDEDGPADVNGDGWITMMRRADPPLDAGPEGRATYLPDPAEPRLLKTADTAKGEQAIYALYVEGFDADGDGLIAEDGAGFVDLDENFPSGWPEFDAHGGTYQLSEVESAAVVQFVLDHRNIVCAVTYGMLDNLVNPPDGKGRDITGQAPKNVEPNDAALYKEISELFKETTGQQRAPKASEDGSLLSWLYAQRGIPSFATVVWGRPDASKASSDEKGNDAPEEPKPQEGADEAAPADPLIGAPIGSWSGNAQIPEMGPVPFTLELARDGSGAVKATFTSAMGPLAMSGAFDAGSGALSLTGDDAQANVSMQLVVTGETLTGTASGPMPQDIPLEARRTAVEGGAGEGDAAKTAGNGKGKGGKDKPADAEAAAWLEYSDRDRDGEGFIDWQPFEHPTLGAVEIGGFRPLFRINPPAEQLEELAGKQTDFIVALADKRPRIELEGPVVQRLAGGLYDVRFAVVNHGYLPTATAIAQRSRSVEPTIVRLSLPIENIVSGDRVNRAWGIAGSGGREAYHWILRRRGRGDRDHRRQPSARRSGGAVQRE